MNRQLFHRPQNERAEWWFFLIFLLPLALGLADCTPLGTAVETPTEPPESMPGAAGIGDTYYDTLGNGGYDVEHYTIELDVEPVANVINGTTTIVASASQSLSSLNLDLAGLVVDSVTVGGRAADYGREGHELTITPAEPLLPNSEFTVAVTYHGSPEPVRSLASPYAGDLVGWFHTDNGVINVMNEPNGAATWFPVNDHPRDKAAYLFEITVPRPYVVVASGLLMDTIDQGEKVRHIWEMNHPMASNFASVNIGDYVLESLPNPKGVIIRSYFPPDLQESSKQDFAEIPEMIALFSDLFGPYPFAAYGVLIADADIEWCQNAILGALENQTLSTHCPGLLSRQERVVAHELAHQWFGNSVSLKNWQDIWLKEGLTTYAEWLWLNRESGVDAVSEVADLQQLSLSDEALIGQPPADDLYNNTVYTGGALIFHALRLRVGEDAFFNILRSYADRYQYGNAGTDDFITLAEEVSGEELQEFFDAWLYSEDLPDIE
jgi:aminopeptidase N